jgi:hypothetical protein
MQASILHSTEAAQRSHHLAHHTAQALSGVSRDPHLDQPLVPLRPEAEVGFSRSRHLAGLCPDRVMHAFVAEGWNGSIPDELDGEAFHHVVVNALQLTRQQAPVAFFF